jgi:hypothetical protein
MADKKLNYDMYDYNDEVYGDDPNNKKKSEFYAEVKPSKKSDIKKYIYKKQENKNEEKYDMYDYLADGYGDER